PVAIAGIRFPVERRGVDRETRRPRQTRRPARTFRAGRLSFTGSYPNRKGWLRPVRRIMCSETVRTATCSQAAAPGRLSQVVVFCRCAVEFAPEEGGGPDPPHGQS